jgi:uncharacterized protein YehS (DUF1456 family)
VNNNDVLRRIRYTFNINDDGMVRLFSLGGAEVTRDDVGNWL